MSNRQSARASVLASLGSGSRLLRCGLATLLFVVPMYGQAASAADPGGATDAVASLSPLQPDSGAVTVDPGKDVTLSTIEKIGDQGVAGQKVEWTVSGPGTAALTPTRSTTAKQSATSDAGVTSTVFHATTSGSYEVTATTQKNPGCATPSCASWVSTRFAVTVSTATAPDPSDKSGGITRNEAIGAALVAGAGVLIAANDSGGNNEKAVAINRTLDRVSGNGQSAAGNAPLAQPLVVLAGNNGVGAGFIGVQWSASGGAVLSSSTSLTGSDGVAAVRVVSVGPGPGPITVTATRSDDSGASVSFTENVILPSLSIVSGNGQTGFTGTRVAQPLLVEAKLGNSAQANIPMTWTVTQGDATVTAVSNGGVTNPSGLSEAVITFGANPGAVEITATRNDGTGLSQTFELTSFVTNTLTIVKGNDQSGRPNRPLPSQLEVRAFTNNRNASGITINWTASNGATLSSAATLTDVNGYSRVAVTDIGSSLGPVIITATRADDPTATVVFTESILPPKLIIHSGNNQSGLITTNATAQLDVELDDGGGVPMVGQIVTFTVTSGSAVLLQSTATTGSQGYAPVSFAYGNFPGPITIQASAFGGAIALASPFNETALAPAGLTKTAGDGLSGAPGSTLSPALTVFVQPPTGSPPVAGIPVSFTVTQGSATVQNGSPTTDNTGHAHTSLMLGLTPGPVTVIAQVAGLPPVTFNETILGSLVQGNLTAVSGGGQTIAPNSQSLPLVVLLKAGTAPLGNQTITWSSTSGTVSASSTTTDSTGTTSIKVTPTVSGSFTVTANFAAVAQYKAASVTFAENTTLVSIPTLTTNGQSVGAALDTACAQLQSISNRTAQQQDLLNQCLGLNSSSAVSTGATASAINQLTPSVSETQSQTASTATTAQFDNLAGRMNALRGGAHGMSLGGLSFNGQNGSLPIFDVGSALLGATDDSAKKQDTTSFSRWGLFASGQIGRQDASAQSDTPGYKLDISGITVGVDYRVSDSFVLGGAVGYTRQTTDLSGGAGNLDMNGWSLSGYATWYRNNDWYLDSSVTWGNNSFDSNRLIDYSLPLPDGSVATVDQIAHASSGGNTLAGSLALGRDFHKQAWSSGLYGKLEYSHESFDPFQEQLNDALPGSGLGLKVDSRTNTSVASVLGAKLDYTHSTSWGVLIPHAEAEWQHEFRTDPGAFTAFFIDDPTNTPILIRSNPLDDDFFRLGLGLSFVFPQGRSAFVLYDRTLGRQGITEYNLSVGFRMEF